MKNIAMIFSLFLVLATNVFANTSMSAPKADIEKMATAIEGRAEKMSLKKWEEYSKFVDTMEADIISFSKSTKLDPKDVMVDLLETFEDRLKINSFEAVCSNVPKLNESCSVRALKNIRYRIARIAIQTVLNRYVKLVSLDNKGNPVLP